VFSEKRVGDFRTINYSHLLLFIIVTSLLVVVPISRADEGGGTGLFINPALVEKNVTDVGSTFQLNVTIQNVTDLWGFDFNLTWNNDLVILVGVEIDSTLNNIWGPDSWFLAKNETGAGYYKLVAVSTSTGFNSTIPTALAILTFQVEPPMSNSISQTLIHFETHKLSDSIPEYIPHTTEDGTYQVTGKTPTLSMSLDKRICRTYHENFTVAVNASNIYNVEEFSFEIHYNTTLLNYVTTKLNAWNEGNITVQESNGIITGSTGGDLKTGNITLITITFHTSLYHIWKECPGWINHLTGTIYFQWANLSYPDIPDLRYEKGVIYQIDVTPVEALHIFAPIQGDVDNDGNVDVFDLRTVAYYYNMSDEDSNWTAASKYNLNCDGIIDHSDLEIVGDNLWFRYNPWQPYAYFVYSPLIPLVNETVTFNASQSVSNEGSIENYEWHFDDSSQGNGRIVNHKYNNPGEYSVTLTVTDDQALTDVYSRVVTVLPSGSYIDVYTQRNGKGLNKSSDAFAPDEYVKMTAYLTYDGTPIPEKQVNFQMYLPNGTIVFNIANETDDNGLTSYSFSIPSDSVFGLYSITATASVVGEGVSDTVWFKVGFLVEILDVIPCDKDGIAKNEFEREDQLYLQVKLQNICFHPKTVTLSISVFDDLSQPILFYTEEYTVSPGQTTILINPGSIPHYAYSGEATVHVLAMDPNGHSYCPTMLAHFYIVSSP